MEFVIVTLSKDDVGRILYQESQGAFESAIGKRDIHGRLLKKSEVFFTRRLRKTPTSSDSPR